MVLGRGRNSGGGRREEFLGMSRGDSCRICWWIGCLEVFGFEICGKRVDLVVSLGRYKCIRNGGFLNFGY